MPCCIARRRESRGATCQSALALGKPSTTSSLAGRISATGLASSKRSRSTSMRTASSSTHQSFERIRTLRAEKGDPKQRIGSFSRWIFHEGPRPRRRARSAAPHRAHARPAARVDSRRKHPQSPRARPKSPRGHGLRLGRDPSLREGARHDGGDPSASYPEDEAAPRSDGLRDAVSRRVLLSPAQAVPRTCITLRQDRTSLSRASSSRLRKDLAR